MNRKPLALLASLFVAAPVLAGPTPISITFTRIEPSNAPENVEAQFTCTLSLFAAAVGPNPEVVNFRFTNTAVIPSSISEIYYDDGTLMGVVSLLQNGCNFGVGNANPGNLPGGQNLSPPFVATQMFSADAVGNPSLGIDTATDYLDMRISLINGMTFADTAAALVSGDLRIGLHVRAIGANGESDSFVNTPMVPLPPALLPGLAGLGMLGLGMSIRRRRQAAG